MFAAEHGQSALDVVNLIEKGANYRWPLVQGEESGGSMKLPFAHSGSATWAPSGIEVYGDELFLAALGSRDIHIFSSVDGELLRTIDVGSRVRDVAMIGAVFMRSRPIDPAW